MSDLQRLVAHSGEQVLKMSVEVQMGFEHDRREEGVEEHGRQAGLEGGPAQPPAFGKQLRALLWIHGSRHPSQRPLETDPYTYSGGR